MGEILKIEPRIETARLAEGVSTGWEHEQRFTREEVIAKVKELVPQATDIQPIKQLLSHEGVLLELLMRAPCSDVGYAYMLKGSHGPGVTTGDTYIERIDYKSADPTHAGYNKIDYADKILDCRTDTWVK